MATPTEKALQAATKEWQAEQRYDKAEAEHRKATRNFCLALAALEASKGHGKASEFTQFCKQYAEKAKDGEVKPRSERMLRKMRNAGLLDVPQHIVEQVAPEKIVVAAAKAASPRSILTEEVAINALAASNGESSEAFAAALDVLAEQMTVLDKDEQVLPAAARKVIPKRDPNYVSPEVPESLMVPSGPEDVITPAEEAENKILAQYGKDQMAAISERMDEGSAEFMEHPAERHLARAKGVLGKTPLYPAQKDRAILLHMEIGALLDGDDTITDASIENFLAAEGDGK